MMISFSNTHPLTCKAADEILRTHEWNFNFQVVSHDGGKTAAGLQIDKDSVIPATALQEVLGVFLEAQSKVAARPARNAAPPTR